MSTTVAPANQTRTPAPRTWTGEEFERLAMTGLFGPHEHLELVNGEIITQMTQNSPHATALRLTEKILNRIFTEGYDVRPQMPLTLGKEDRPEPDIAVVRGTTRDYAKQHPQTAVLVVEISDSTLQYDQTDKLGVYARAAVPEYWIVNLPERVLEVYRQPEPMPDAPSATAIDKSSAFPPPARSPRSPPTAPQSPSQTCSRDTPRHHRRTTARLPHNKPTIRQR